MIRRIIAFSSAILPRRFDRMTISLNLFRRKTYEDRIRLWALTRLVGFHERTAVDWIWPLKDRFGRRQNGNRIGKFRNWKRKGIWPPSEEELQQAKSQGLFETEELKRLLADHEAGQERRTQLLEQASELLTIMPDEEIERRTLSSPTVAHVERVHVGCRLPIHYVEKLKNLGGKRSTHIVRAIRLYLAVKKLEAEGKFENHERKS